MLKQGASGAVGEWVRADGQPPPPLAREARRAPGGGRRSRSSSPRGAGARSWGSSGSSGSGVPRVTRSWTVADAGRRRRARWSRRRRRSRAACCARRGAHVGRGGGARLAGGQRPLGLRRRLSLGQDRRPRLAATDGQLGGPQIGDQRRRDRVPNLRRALSTQAALVHPPEVGLPAAAAADEPLTPAERGTAKRRPRKGGDDGVGPGGGGGARMMGTPLRGHAADLPVPSRDVAGELSVLIGGTSGLVGGGSGAYVTLSAGSISESSGLLRSDPPLMTQEWEKLTLPVETRIAAHNDLLVELKAWSPGEVERVLGQTLVPLRDVREFGRSTARSSVCPATFLSRARLYMEIHWRPSSHWRPPPAMGSGMGSASAGGALAAEEGTDRIRASRCSRPTRASAAAGTQWTARASSRSPRRMPMAEEEWEAAGEEEAAGLAAGVEAVGRAAMVAVVASPAGGPRSRCSAAGTARRTLAGNSHPTRSKTCTATWNGWIGRSGRHRSWRMSLGSGTRRGTASSRTILPRGRPVGRRAERPSREGASVLSDDRYVRIMRRVALTEAVGHRGGAGHEEVAQASRRAPCRAARDPLPERERMVGTVQVKVVEAKGLAARTQPARRRDERPVRRVLRGRLILAHASSRSSSTRTGRGGDV